MQWNVALAGVQCETCGVIMSAVASAGPAGSAAGGPSSHGVESYYTQRLDELDLQNRERTENLQRLRAQRNELNTKGAWHCCRQLVRNACTAYGGVQCAC